MSTLECPSPQWLIINIMYLIAMREKLKLKSRPMVVQVVAERRWTMLGLYTTSVLSTETPCSSLRLHYCWLRLHIVHKLGRSEQTIGRGPVASSIGPYANGVTPGQLLVGSIIVRRRAGVGFAAKRRKPLSAPALSDRQLNGSESLPDAKRVRLPSLRVPTYN